MIGNQYPRIRIEPKRTGTDGDGAAMLMQAYGVALDEWQKLILDSILGTDEKGNYTTISAGISLPRQNGKSELLIARTFYGLIVNGERILFTAHQLASVKKVFRRLVNMFTDKNHPEIVKLVKKIREAIGEESIELNNGGIVEFKSRSRQGARGFDGISVIIYDEAAELTDEQAEAIMSVLSASKTGTRQVIYAGTPTYIGCTGTVFKRLRNSCIYNTDKENIKNSWHEWSIAADNLNDVNLEDTALWRECNPSLGTRITEEWVREEFNTLSPGGFARERLGFWAKEVEATKEPAIKEELWDSRASEEMKPEGKTAFGVKFSADGATVALAGCVLPGRTTNGGRMFIADLNGFENVIGRKQTASTTAPGRISLIQLEPTGMGLQWLADFLNARYKTAACVVIDGKNGADVLIDKIKDVWKIRGSVIKPTSQDVITAANMLCNELVEGGITWYKGQEVLRESAITSTKRQIGQGWGFGGSLSAPIEACSLALWGCKTSKRNPSNQMRIG